RLPPRIESDHPSTATTAELHAYADTSLRPFASASALASASAMHRAASVNRPILLNCSSCRARRGRGQHGRHVSTPHFALASPHLASTKSTTMASRLPLQRITVEVYYRMAENGRLAPEARVELIEGTIVDMPPIGSLHSEV